MQLGVYQQPYGCMLYSSIVDVWKQTFNFPMEMTYP